MMKNPRPSRYLALLLSLALALSAPVFALRLIAYLAFFLLLVSMIYNIVVPRIVEIRRLDPELQGTRRQPLIVRTVLRNRLPIPIPQLSLLESPGKLYCDRPAGEISLAPNGTKTWATSLRSEHRGEFRFGPIRLHGSDPFGFFEWERIDGSLGRAIVFPRIYPLLLANRRGVVGGSVPIADPVYEDVTRFRSLREYLAGDEPKRVNWKASAKSGKLYTTEFERTLTVGVKILLNLMEDDYPTRKRDQFVERAVETAAAMVFSYTRLGQPVGLSAAAGMPEERLQKRGGSSAKKEASSPFSFEARSGWYHSNRILELLARVNAQSGSADYLSMAFGRGSGLPAGTRLMVVGPVPNPEQTNQLRTIRARHIQIDYFLVASTGAVESGTVGGVCPVHRVSEFGEKIIDG